MMKHKLFVLMGSSIALTCLLPAQTTGYEQWVGVWEGRLDSQPGVTVTLGRDAGDLQGTIVFNVVARENGEARVIGHDAHVLTHVNVNDGTVAFRVIRLGDARELHLTLKLTESNKAVLECADCGGPGATEVTRIQ
jgi:hypothetical protein